MTSHDIGTRAFAAARLVSAFVVASASCAGSAAHFGPHPAVAPPVPTLHLAPALEPLAPPAVLPPTLSPAPAPLLAPTPASPPAPSEIVSLGPPIRGVAVGPHEVRVTGSAFPPRAQVTIEVDFAVPHASVACKSEFTVQAKSDENGDVRATVRTRGDSDCSFDCEDDALVAFAETDQLHLEAQSPRFLCARSP